MESDRRLFLVGSAALLAGGSAVLVGCNYDWITTALNDLPTIGDTLTQVAALILLASGNGLLTPAIVAAIQSAISAVQVGLTLLKQIIADYQANPSASLLEKARLTLMDIQANLSVILTDARVNNVALRATIAGVIGIAILAVTEIMNIFPNTTKVAAATSPAKLSSPSWATKPRAHTELAKLVNGCFTEWGYSQFATVK